MINQELPPGVTRVESRGSVISFEPEQEAILNDAITNIGKYRKYSLIIRAATYSLLVCALGMMASIINHTRLLHFIFIGLALVSSTVAIIFEIKRDKLTKAHDK